MYLQRNIQILSIVVLVCLNIYCFWPWHLYFLNDDFLHIPLTDAGNFFQQKSIRPVHEVLVKLDLWCWGNNAAGFHITALLLFFILAFELYIVANTISIKLLGYSKEKAKQVAFLTLVLFLIYPQHTEAIAWILGRTPTLSAIFILPVVQIFFKEKLRFIQFAVAALLFLLALFTYEQGISLIGFFLLIAIIHKNKQQLKLSLFLVVCSVVYLIVRKLITADVLGTYEAAHLQNFNITILLSNAYKLISRLLLNPVLNGKDYVWQLVGGILFVISLLLCCGQQITKKQWWLLVPVFLLLVPVISLGITVRSYESGRYLIFPAMFLCIFFATIFINTTSKVGVLFLVLLTAYWLWGKLQAAQHFKQASAYSYTIQEKIHKTFLNNRQQNIVIDTLHITIKRLPVYRMGFTTGAMWLNKGLDTNKIKVNYYYDEFIEEP